MQLLGAWLKCISLSCFCPLNSRKVCSAFRRFHGAKLWRQLCLCWATKCTAGRLLRECRTVHSFITHTKPSGVLGKRVPDHPATRRGHCTRNYGQFGAVGVAKGARLMFATSAVSDNQLCTQRVARHDLHPVDTMWVMRRSNWSMWSLLMSVCHVLGCLGGLHPACLIAAP